MKSRIIIKGIHILLLLALAVSTFASADYLMNYLHSTLYMTDGISCHSILQFLFGVFDRVHWSPENYLKAFESSLWVTVLLLFLNIIWKCAELIFSGIKSNKGKNDFSIHSNNPS